MYDIHCHILPGLDDGSGFIDETLEMVQIAVSGHTKGIICTPHDSPPEPYPVEKITGLIAEVKTLLEKNNLRLELYPGQEILLTGQALERLIDGRLLTLNNTSYVLVEFGPGERSAEVFAKLEKLRANGLLPIVAHPERYRFVKEDSEAPALIKGLGCLLQVNKGSLKGGFGRDASRAAHRMLERREADFVASDAHSPYVRTPFLGDTREMISEYYSMEYADFLLSANPVRIIKNQRIYPY